MGIAKVTLNGITQMDNTGVDVAANNLLLGHTAIGADGELVIGAVSISGLPSGYTEQLCIVATGSQYINTGLVPTTNTRLECEFSLTAAKNTNMAMFGVQNTGQFSFRQYSSTVFRTNGGNNVDFSDVKPNTARHIVIKTMTGTILDYEGKVTTAPTSITNNLFLCALDNAGSASQFAEMSLYWCKIYSGATLVRDFLPCKNSNNVAGLYDKVNGVFYSSASGTDFNSTALP